MTIIAGAMPIAVFCKTYGVGRTKTYDLINSGVVSARKSGKKTLIDRASAERWYASLPSYDASYPERKVQNRGKVEVTAPKVLRT